jgi:hypothetical protein
MENNLQRNLITPSRLKEILANFEHYRTQTKPILHPSHLSPEEKRLRANKRARAKRAKK